MKKLLLSLGTLAAASTPALTVVACSAASISDEQQKQIDRLTSAQALNRLERVWLEELMKDYMVANNTGQWTGVVLDNDENLTYNGETLALKNGEINKEVLATIPHAQDAFKWFIEEQLLSNSTYLTSVKEALDEEPEFNGAYEFLEEDGVEIPNEIRGYASNFDALGFNADYIGETWFNKVIDIDDANVDVIEIHVEFSEGSTDFGDSIDATSTHPEFNGATTDNNKYRTILLDTTTKATEWVMSTLFDKDILGLVNELFRMFLVEDYMAISRDEWNNVFGDDYRENNSNISGSSEWETLHLLIQEESDFPLIKFGLDNKPFMSWEVSVTGDDALAFANAQEITTANEALKHFSTTTATVDHVGSTVESIAYSQSHRTNFSRINEFGIIGDGTINTDHNSIFADAIGYQGINPVVSQGEGKLKMDSQTSLRLANETGYYNGFLDVDGKDVITEDISLNDSSGTLSLTKYVSLMPLYDDTSIIVGTENDNWPTAEKNRLTYDAIQSYKEENGEVVTDGASSPLSLWADDKDLLTWYFYQMSPTDIWNDARAYFIDENGLDFKLGITSQFVYDVYIDLGIDYIKKV